METAVIKTRKKRAFKREMRHRVLSYVVIVSFLAFVNYMTCPFYPWVLWVMAGWGIGIALRGLNGWLDYRDENY